jgi:hypothetical protein
MSKDFEVRVTEIPRQAVAELDMVLHRYTPPTDPEALKLDEEWGAQDWVDFVNSLVEDANRFFILNWRGPKEPIGAVVLGYPITRVSDFEVRTHPDETGVNLLGYYQKMIDEPSQRQILLMVNDRKLPNRNW